MIPTSPAPTFQVSSLPAAQSGLKIERKKFSFHLGENVRGKFLRITEEVGGRFDSIVIPLSGVEQFRAAMESAINASRQPTPAAPPAVLIVQAEYSERQQISDQICQAQAFTAEPRFTYANDDHETLHWLRRRSFDLVILDYNLPTIAEDSVLRHLRQQRLPVPVLVLSPHEGRPLRTAVADLQAAHLPKTQLTPDKLRQAIIHAWALVSAERVVS